MTIHKITLGEGRNLTGGTLPWCRWLAAEGADSEQADGQLADEAVKLLAEKRETLLVVGSQRQPCYLGCLLAIHPKT